MAEGQIGPSAHRAVVAPAVPATDVHHITQSVPEVLADPALVADMERGLRGGAVYVVPTGIDHDLLVELKAYLRSVGQHSLPTYHPIEHGAPNTHRMNNDDERAHVRGRFHQFSFFPWNQDVFGLFDLFAPSYHLKNRLSGLDATSFLGRTPELGCTARISCQFYPRGGGGLNPHTDPVDRHQLTVPLMELGRRGEDFDQGGIYVIREDGSTLDAQEHLGWGDLLLFNAATPHGVATIDSGEQLRWHRFEGRWMVLLTVNKLASVADIADSVDLGR